MVKQNRSVQFFKSKSCFFCYDSLKHVDCPMGCGCKCHDLTHTAMQAYLKKIKEGCFCAESNGRVEHAYCGCQCHRD